MVLRTYAGSEFMQVFNAFYYSFSPGVASYIYAHPVAGTTMKVILYPLMGILHSAAITYSVLSFSQPVAVLAAGLVASSLIGLEDGKEIELGTDPLVADTDHDGLADGKEVELGTDPLEADTDSDGLNDGEEVNRHGTDPLKADTDDDGLSDSREIKLGTNPVSSDTDNDRLSDEREVELGTDPLKADTDGDYWRDSVDIASTNVLIPNALIVLAILACAATAAVAVSAQKGGKRHVSSRAAYPELPLGPTSPQTAATTDEASRFCVECGVPVQSGARYCHKCGAEQPPVTD
jgi:hypothetical protein